MALKIKISPCGDGSYELTIPNRLIKMLKAAQTKRADSVGHQPKSVPISRPGQEEALGRINGTLLYNLEAWRKDVNRSLGLHL